PLGVLGFRSWQLRTAGRREEAAEVRAARRRVEELLDRGEATPAREIAGPLAAALRELARVTGCAGPSRSGEAASRGPSEVELDPAAGKLLARLETESFAPEAASRPLSPDLRSDAAGLLRRWANAARRGTKRPGTPSSSAAVLALVSGLSGLAALGLA